MAIRDGQLGFWAKRSEQAAPEFVAVPDGYAGGLDAAKKNWTGRSNTEWVGEDPQDFYFEAATGNVKKFTPAVNDPVEETYFDEILRNIEDDAQALRNRAQQSHETFIKHLKEGRELFDEDLSRQYGKSLQKLNEGQYMRGLASSGVRDAAFSDVTADRDFTVKDRNITDAQKQEVKRQDLSYQLDSINRTEMQTKQARDRAMASPYAKFSYI